jgi:multidrug resistance efflux pump
MNIRGPIAAAPAALVALITFVASGARAPGQGAAQGATGAAKPVAAPAAAAAPQIVAVASVNALWSADLYARASGYVAEVRADLGDVVKKGQLLALIANPELERDLGAAQATLAARQEMVAAADAAALQVQATLDVATRQVGVVEAERQLADVTLRRNEELFATKAVTEQQIDDARTRAAVAAANVEVARAKVASVQADLVAARANAAVARGQVAVAEAEVARVQARVDYLRIVAPFDGVVTRREASPGDLVEATAGARGAPLFTCQQLDTVRVLCDVPEESAALIAVGDAAEVKVFGLGGEVVTGSVTRTAHAIDAKTRKMRTEVDLPNPDGRLRPGMYAEARITPKGAKPGGPR